MTSIINASPTNGLVQTADGSGVLKVQSNGVTTNALAWVNFNGTGTVAIRSSYNVSSITDNGTGDYTVNFTTALADANYAVESSAANSLPLSGSAGFNNGTAAAPTSTSAARVVTFVNSTTAVTDCESVSVSVFGN